MEEKEQKSNVVYLSHNHTPEMQKLFDRGLGTLNEVISEFELKRREAREKTPATAG